MNRKMRAIDRRVAAGITIPIRVLEALDEASEQANQTRSDYCKDIIEKILIERGFNCNG